MTKLKKYRLNGEDDNIINSILSQLPARIDASMNLLRLAVSTGDYKKYDYATLMQEMIEDSVTEAYCKGREQGRKKKAGRDPIFYMSADDEKQPESA